MVAILGGLGAAVAWAVSTLCSSRSSRVLEPVTVVAWVMLVGLVLTAPAAALQGIPGRLDLSSGGWLFISGAGNVCGLMVTYTALRIGKVAVVAPVVSTEGAFTAVIALVAGETLAPGIGATLALIVVGICLAAAPPGDRSASETTVAAGAVGEGDFLAAGGSWRHQEAAAGGTSYDRWRSGAERALRAHHLQAVLLALIAAAVFGTSLYATARAGAVLPVAWVVLAARLIGALALAIPLALAGRLRLTRSVVPLVLAAGVCEVLGFYSYTLGSRHGVAVAAVLSSQFAALAALAAFIFFGERLSRIQMTGVCIVIAGVALLSALRA